MVNKVCGNEIKKIKIEREYKNYCWLAKYSQPRMTIQLIQNTKTDIVGGIIFIYGIV